MGYDKGHLLGEQCTRGGGKEGTQDLNACKGTPAEDDKHWVEVV